MVTTSLDVEIGEKKIRMATCNNVALQHPKIENLIEILKFWLLLFAICCYGKLSMLLMQ